MRDSEDLKTPEEQLEELEVLQHLDARDVLSEAVHAGDESAKQDEASLAAMRRRMWLGLRLALIITLGVVLITAAWFRWIAPPAPVEEPVDITQPVPEVAQPAVTTSSETQPDPLIAEMVQAQVGQTYRWRLDTGMDHLQPPVFAGDGCMYILGRPQGSWWCTLYAIAPDGRLKWTYQPEELSGRQALFFGRGGSVLMVEDTHNPIVRALDARGQEDWVLRLEGKYIGAVLSPERRTLYVARFVGWRQYQEAGQRRHTQVRESTITALNESGETVWESTLAGEIEDNPMRGSGGQVTTGICLDEHGVIYTCASQQLSKAMLLRAINARGELLWEYSSPEDGRGLASLAIGPRKRVYATSPYYTGEVGQLFAFDARGNLEWSAEVGPLKGELPQFAADGTIYLRCNPKEASYDDHQLRALDPRDGGMLWSVPGDGSSVTIGPDGTVYYSLREGLCAIRPDGMVKWQSKWTGEPQFGKDGKLYIGAAVLSAEGRELYQLPRLGEGSRRTCIMGPDGTVYLLTDAGEIFALNE